MRNKEKNWNGLIAILVVGEEGHSFLADLGPILSEEGAMAVAIQPYTFEQEVIMIVILISYLSVSQLLCSILN